MAREVEQWHALVEKVFIVGNRRIAVVVVVVWKGTPGGLRAKVNADEKTLVFGGLQDLLLGLVLVKLVQDICAVVVGKASN